jgi:hypothetical protein
MMPLIRIALSKEDMLYLRNSDFLSENLKDIIDVASSNASSESLLEISPAIAEDFRSLFTERLAKVGFDSRYKLTREGALLEKLIDKFFFGDES